MLPPHFWPKMGGGEGGKNIICRLTEGSLYMFCVIFEVFEVVFKFKIKECTENDGQFVMITKWLYFFRYHFGRILTNIDQKPTFEILKI